MQFLFQTVDMITEGIGKRIKRMIPYMLRHFLSADHLIFMDHQIFQNPIFLSGEINLRTIIGYLF